MKFKFNNSITNRSTTAILAASMLGLLMTSILPMPNDSNIAIVHAASDSTAVMKKINSVKSGSYTYYYNSRDLVREDKNGKVQKLADKITGDFYVTEDYVYYVTLNDSYLYRMNKNGSNKQRLSKRVRSILRVEGDYIYYRHSTLAIYRININGTDNKKLLGVSNSYHYIFSNGRIYYISRIKDQNGYVSSYSISSMNMAGTNKKTHNTIPVSEMGYYNFGLVASKNYVYLSSNKSIYKMDQEGKVSELYSCKTSENLEVLYGTDTNVYFMVTASDSNQMLIQKMKSNGSISTFVDSNHIGATVLQGVKLEKSNGYFILYCYGDDSNDQAFVLNTNGELIQEVPNKIKSFVHSHISKVIIRGNKIYVEYIDLENGNILYKVYDLTE